MTLPVLDTASFDALLPLAVQQLGDEDYALRLQRETRLALRVLASPTETPEDADPMLTRLEAKLDLALEVSLQARHPARPPLTPCRLGLSTIAWLSDHPWPQDSRVLMTLAPNPDSALMLQLPARVETQQPTPDEGYAITARLLLNDDDTTGQLWEKWVFRRHRRAIQER
ncbi:hypothetical protein [uncultured Aquitalea sp.]|uniref:hypothetical protein n=1 Tax=uncultured Aquitalea sp. TaxID=540272 RepID=UPI0025FE23A8|nr:hypothetical protein [uncultured Aquitalea sp.]